MPDQPPMTAGASAILRARQFMGRAGGAVRDFAEHQFTGARNAIPGTRNFDPRQTSDMLIPGDWWASQNAPGNRFLPQRLYNNVRNWFGGNDPGQPLQPGQVPSNQMPPAPLPGQQGLPATPTYQDPNQVGPPAYMAGNTPMPRQVDPTAGRQGTAGRHGRTIAEGQDAVNFARGIGHAHSGLGASSYGRDRMMQTNREG